MIGRLDLRRARIRASAPGRRIRAAAALCAVLVLSACGAAAQSSDPAPALSAAASGEPSVAAATHTPAASLSPGASGEPSSPASDAAAASCAEIERPPLQAGSHLIGDHEPPVPYSSQPPTSGWHSSGHFDVDVRGDDDPLPEPDQVSVLEAGGVVVAYGKLPDGAVDALGDHVRENYEQRVAVTPYGPLDAGAVAFTSWGVLQRCDGVDLDALDRFVAEFGTDEPIEPGH